MQLRFTKMHGLGNDFVIIDGVTQHVKMTPAIARRLADRHFGIGCDQILLVEKPRSRDADFRYRIWNADGGEVEQCGNGARCFARFVRDRDLTQKKEIRVETKKGIITLHVEPNDDVRVNMGKPIFAPEDIPFTGGSLKPVQLLEMDGAHIEVSTLSMGNPHVVQIVADVENAPVTTQGPLLEHHPRFPEKVNAGYMQVTDKSNIKLRVWERGAGETLACGTGACAAVVAGIWRGLLDASVSVETRGGELRVRWDGDDAPVWMTGPAVTVFEGVVDV